MSAYMFLLAPDDATGGHMGVMEPIHYMDVKNVAVFSSNVHPR